jgi:3-oxoacyl-ACP reductase-like protein
MNRVTALAGIAVLAMLAGCAKKEAPAAHAQADEDEDVPAAVQGAPAAAQPEPTVDRNKAAAEMSALIDPAPQCQQYRDQLQAKGSTPGVMDEMNEILVQAYKAGCGKKKAPQQ